VCDDPAGVAGLVGLHVVLGFLGLADVEAGGVVHLAHLVDRQREHRISPARLLVRRRAERADLAVCRGLPEPGLIAGLETTPALAGELLELAGA